MPSAADDVFFAERQNVRQRTNLLGSEHRRPRQERLNRRVRDGRYSSVGCRAAQAGADPGAVTLLHDQADLGSSIGADRQRQGVTGINKVRIGDLRVDVPDLGPQPGVLQEHRRDTPKGVAPLDHVALGRRGIENAAVDRRARRRACRRLRRACRDCRLGGGHVLGARGRVRNAGTGGNGQRRGRGFSVAGTRMATGQ